MKKFICLTILLSYFQLNAQQVWESLPPNPNVLSSAVYDFEMIDGKVYQFFNQDDGGGYTTSTYYFNPVTQDWVFSGFVASTQMTKLITQKIGTTIYLVGYDNSEFTFWKYEYPLMDPVMVVQNYPVLNVNNNWAFETGNGDEELYILYTREEGATDYIYGLERNPGLTWNEMSAESSTSDLSQAKLQIQVTQNDVYFGVYTTRVRATRFEKGNIQTIFPYEGTGTGIIQSNGSDWISPGFVLSGNKNNYIAFYGTEDSNNQSYEYEMDGFTIIDVDLASPSTNFNLNPAYVAKESSASHGFIFSMFRNDGETIGLNEELKVIRRDFVQDTPWEVVGGLVHEDMILEENTLNLSLDNGNRHLLATYLIQGNTTPELKVLNEVPFEYPASTAANTGLCQGQMNEIYSNVEIEDIDFDQISVLSAISVNGTTTNIFVIPNGYSNGVSKFKILGNPGPNSDEIEITYTDGYGTYTLVLGSFTATTPATNVQFISNPVIFCENEQQIDLSQYVNYYDQGTFRLNGFDLNNTLINASNLSSLMPNGNLRYIVNINGCFIQATANYQIVTPPSISMATTPSTCSSNSGEAVATVNPGTSPNVNFYWNTGHTTTTISDLPSGSYYAFAMDDNNCKATALASIDATDITITPTVTNPTCFDSNNGSISLAVTGVTDYFILWQNGYNANSITNLPRGNYEYTLYEAGGCQIRNSIQLTSPPKIEANITTLKPDCGASNGAINASISGGVLPYQYLWNTSSTNEDLLNLSQGFYSLTVTDGNNCVFKDSLFLNNDLSVIIQDSLILPSCNQNNGGINLNIIVPPLGGTINSILWDNGATTEDIFNLYSGNYMVSINSGANCISQKSFYLGNKAPLKNDMCVVTVDTASITNLIVWEKNENDDVQYYNIYRENDDAGNYLLIDTVQFSNLSVFNDVVASPLHRSWRYRISAVNSCDVESPLSVPHKTLHLNTIAQPTPGVFNVYWDAYEGLSSGEYVVYRHTDADGWINLSPTVPFGANTVFTDTPPVGYTGLDYFVSFELASPCTATYRAQDFNHSRSNKEKGIFNPGSGAGDYSNNSVFEYTEDDIFIQIYPNPASSALFIEFLGTKSMNIEIVSLDGQVLSKNFYSEGISQINVSDLSKGIYFIRADFDSKTKTIMFVKD
jgi:hypothetical protein